MTQELWIDGQSVDLGGDTSITLEWVSGLFEDIGSIQLSRSYTITLPKTARNLRILDDPSNPAHRSSKTRRYLDARYIRNGIDLLGSAKAYVMSTGSAGIEVGLIWRTVPGLLEWKESGKKLGALQSLPTLKWVGSNGQPDYTGQYFAKYYSGLDSYGYPTVNAAPHPSVQFWELFDSIFREAGVRWFGYADDELNEIDSLYRTKLLCDGHRPSKAMDLASGSSSSSRGYVTTDNARIAFERWSHAWDRTLSRTVYPDGRQEFATTSLVDETRKDNMYFQLSVQNQTPGSYSLLDNSIQVVGEYQDGYILKEKILADIKFELVNGAEVCRADLELDVKDMGIIFLRYRTALPSDTYGGLIAFGGESIRVTYAHETISIANDNRYPIPDNLPDITQVDFIKGACALLGLIPVVTSDSTLKFVEYATILDPAAAADWTHKVAGDIDKVSLTEGDLARRNLIAYAEDKEVSGDYDATIVVEDETLAESHELFKLPFGASNGSSAEHYHVTPEIEEGVAVYNLEDVDIKPRVFVWSTDTDGSKVLDFPGYFKGAGLVAKYYQRFQDIVRTPVVIEVLVRLTEIDLVTLDFTRPVYLSQTGQYYSILKVQDDGNGFSKTTLIQI